MIEKWTNLWLVGIIMSIVISGTGDVAKAAEIRQSYLWLNAGAREFGGWQRAGTMLSGDSLQLDSANLRAGRDPYGSGSYHGGNYYNGGSYFYGEALAPYYRPTNGFDSAIVSWNAITPTGTWVELRIKVLIGNHWTREYVMSIWSTDTDVVRRHSLDTQSDADGRVDTDTLNLAKRATTFQIRAMLFTTNPAQTPRLDLVAVNAIKNGAKPNLAPDSTVWGRDIAVPERSQMIYPDGGENWCSPTSSSMILAYWAGKTGRPELVQSVPSAAAHTYDWIYGGTGNWPFNTAYAGSFSGLEAYVTRLLSLSQIEAWIKQGVPVTVSIAYRPGQLDGAPISQSNGHLLIVRGFDQAGNVITNDPAANPNLGQHVRIVYNRAQFEARWLESSGGAAYLIIPHGWNIPPTESGQNWAVNLSERSKLFADSRIADVWHTADQSVANGTTGRGWLWGPQPLTAGQLEPYSEGPGGNRLVQYFDKSRMEITHPDSDASTNWFVTNGLLTVELVTGQIQIGNNRYQTHNPANIPVAGDSDSTLTPTYATFSNLATVGDGSKTRRAANRQGQTVNATLARNGQIDNSGPNGVIVPHYDNEAGHNLPDVFWAWMNDSERSGLKNGWLYGLGYPISEPYWVRVKVAGKDTVVLVQLFERRALTWNPTNPAAFQVEMGNIGQHYLAWRY